MTYNTALVPLGRPRDPNIASEDRYCEEHKRNCEHRRWKRGKNADGTPRYRWVCALLQNERNKAYYADKARD
jgi:hypothetical protein